jgi:hypothetical protein
MCIPRERDSKDQRGGDVGVIVVAGAGRAVGGALRTEMTKGVFPADAPWTPPELTRDLVRRLATGRYDALVGRYLHAEHDDIDELLRRIDGVRERDANAAQEVARAIGQPLPPSRQPGPL